MRSLSGASLAVIAMLTLGSFASVGCGKVGEIKAKKAFKSANQAYQAAVVLDIPIWTNKAVVRHNSHDPAALHQALDGSIDQVADRLFLDVL